jgi:predicted  nucleic acid-binding Zn-ribbon protein
MATKKTVKKVETPIDERETFVSLQKNFADSEISVEEKLHALYALQGVDNDLEKLIQLRGELPAEVAALEEDIAALESKVAHMQESIEGYRQTIEAKKGDIVEIDAEIQKYQGQLENIANSREYDSINKELENTGYLRLIAQKNIDESRQKIEDCKAVIDELQDRITVRRQDLDAKNEELDKIKSSTAKDEEILQDRRKEFTAKLDARTLSAYDRIRGSVHNHLAVVPVYRGNACGGCFNIITPQRLVDIAEGRKLIICEHCGRIIVNPGEDKEEK